MYTEGYVTNFTDPDTSINYPQAFINPKPIIILINYYVSTQLRVYATQQDYENDVEPVNVLNIVVPAGTQDYDNYFSQQVVNQQNVNFIDQFILYLKTLYPENG